MRTDSARTRADTKHMRGPKAHGHRTDILARNEARVAEVAAEVADVTAEAARGPANVAEVSAETAEVAEVAAEGAA